MTTKPTYEELEKRVKELGKEVVEKGRLEKQLQLMSLAIGKSSEGMAVVDLDGNLEYLNNTFAEMHGYSIEELIGKNLSVFHASEQMLTLEAANRQLKETGDFKGEIWHIRRDGTAFPAIMHNSIVQDNDGNPIGVVVTLRDISEMKQAEKALQESLEKFELISEQSLMAIVIVQDDKIKYANLAYLAMTGYTWEEIMSWTVGDTAQLIHPDDRHFVLEQGRKKASGIRDGVVTHYSYRGVAKSGEVRWIDQYSKTITYKGKPADLMTFIDIHEQKLAQEILRKSEERYRELADSLPEVVFETDEKGSLTYANRNAFDYFGFTESDFDSGLNALQMVIPEDRDRAMENMREVLNGEILGSVEYTALRKDGSTFPVLIHSKAFFRDNKSMGLRGIIIDLTDIRGAEEALRESEEKYRNIFNNAQIGIFRSRISDGKVLECNDSFARTHGYETSQECKDDFVASQHYTDPGAREKMLASLMERGDVSDLENSISRRDGKVIWFRFSARAYPEEGYLEGVGYDITEQKRAEEALRESEKRYRQLFENSTDFVYTIDLKGNFTDVNKASKDLTGYTKNEVIGMNYRDYTPEDSHERIFKAFERVFAQGEPLKDFPLEVTIKDGTKRYFETCVSPLWKGDDIIGLQGSSRDITKRMESEKERNELQVQLSNAMEMAHLARWEYDIADDLFTFNDHFYKIFRTTAKEVGGYTMPSAEYARRFVHPGDMHVVGEETRRAIESTDPHFSRQLEHRILYADGTIGHIAVRFFIVKDAQGKTIKTYGVNQDITERKKMEEELLRAQKIEAVGLFAGGIAHDFNNILTTILGNVSMARMQAGPKGEMLDLLSEAEMASTRAQTLTKQLLTFAKGGAPVKETASIEDILKESSSFVLRGSKSSCEFSIAEGLWPVEVDTGQISQVINNIVINANQAMPRGGIIRVEAENLIIAEGWGFSLKPGRYIRISITDQGVGIAEKHLSNIFDPYFTTKQEGSGLGLATTYSIIKKHNGHITVESQLGVGTTFHIYLPASDKAVPEKEEVKPIKGQGRILMMDDEASLRKMVRRMLENLGYESDFAKDGAEAIRIYKEAQESEKPYDAVILDLTIPGGMGGKEAIEKLLEIDPEVKAIVSSGYSDDPVLSNFQEYGFKGMMPKPFEFRLLSNVLHEVLQGEKE